MRKDDGGRWTDERHSDTDSRPSLTLQSPFLSPKVSDFGLAKADEAPTVTATGQVMGTPGYMAPEQTGSGQARPATDVYALGAILYHMLTGRPPFLGADPIEVLVQVVHVDPVSVRRLIPSAPRDLETICLKCLQKSPAKRYSTVSAR